MNELPFVLVRPSACTVGTSLPVMPVIGSIERSDAAQTYNVA